MVSGQHGQAVPPGKTWRPGAEGDSTAGRSTALPVRRWETESASPDQKRVWKQ